MSATRTVRLGNRDIPVTLPNRRDARLHTAAVIISVHVIGITALGFRVSVPQILVAILTAGLIDVAITFRNTGRLVWPASGMLTGSGVALILRLVAMDSGDYWSWSGWHWFALVSGLSVLTKYLIRLGGSHVFNPSNIGLVLAFLIVGRGVMEPLDFWWAPLEAPMILAYAVIVGGGIVITRRLRLLESAIVFWVALALGLGVLAASGHCMTAAWSPTPVCDARFWTVLVTSPEILIFLFFMITDPKTIPAGPAARVAFAASLGMGTAVMIAPHAVEFGAKVALLGSLALWSPLRIWFDRLMPDTSSDRSGLGELIARLTARPPAAAFARGLLGGGALILTSVGIVAAGINSREPAVAAVTPTAVEVEVDPSTLADVVVDESVHGLDIDVDDEFIDTLALTLAENLAVEAEAMRTADGSLLAAADAGDRLNEMRTRLDEAIATGVRRVDEYSFDSLLLSVHEAPAGQSSAGLVFTGEGRVNRVIYDAHGEEVEGTSEPFQLSFVLRQFGSDHWVIVLVEEPA